MVKDKLNATQTKKASKGFRTWKSVWMKPGFYARQNGLFSNNIFHLTPIRSQCAAFPLMGMFRRMMIAPQLIVAVNLKGTQQGPGAQMGSDVNPPQHAAQMADFR